MRGRRCRNVVTDIVANNLSPARIAGCHAIAVSAIIRGQALAGRRGETRNRVQSNPIRPGRGSREYLSWPRHTSPWTNLARLNENRSRACARACLMRRVFVADFSDSEVMARASYRTAGTRNLRVYTIARRSTAARTRRLNAACAPSVSIIDLIF